MLRSEARLSFAFELLSFRMSNSDQVIFALVTPFSNSTWDPRHSGALRPAGPTQSSSVVREGLDVK
jgi:hypothetical protein